MSMEKATEMKPNDSLDLCTGYFLFHYRLALLHKTTSAYLKKSSNECCHGDIIIHYDLLPVAFDKNWDWNAALWNRLPLAMLFY